MEKKTRLIWDTRGTRNKNPFNIKRSCSSWKGKINVKRATDRVFEQFISMEYGIRAGILLLANAYIRKGYNTPQKIISRYAPSNENDTSRYIDFVCAVPDLAPEKEIILRSYDFYVLCKRICLFESGYDLYYNDFKNIVSKNHIF